MGQCGSSLEPLHRTDDDKQYSSKRCIILKGDMKGSPLSSCNSTEHGMDEQASYRFLEKDTFLTELVQNMACPGMDDTNEDEDSQEPSTNETITSHASTITISNIHQQCSFVKDFGMKLSQNKQYRKNMEDQCVIIPSLPTQYDQYFFVGLYDGHGGTFTSQYVANQLHLTLQQTIEEQISQSTRAKDIVTHNSVEDSIIKANNDISIALTETFAKVDSALEDFDQADQCGTTAIACLIRQVDDSTLVCSIANVGDSRMLYYSSKHGTERLTEKHHVSNTDEVKRIKSLNGIILNKRVSGVSSVTRALGQCDEKEFIIGTPFIATKTITIQNDNSATNIEETTDRDRDTVDRVEEDTELKFLLFVTDGVSDMLSDADLIEMVLSELQKQHSAEVISQEIIKRAKLKGSLDNMSSVIIML